MDVIAGAGLGIVSAAAVHGLYKGKRKNRG